MTTQDVTPGSSPADTASASAADVTTGSSPTDTSVSPAQTADTQAPAATPGDKDASPPNAPTDDRASLLDIVRKVVEPDPKTPPQGEGTPAALEPKGDASPDPAPAADVLEADPTADELKALPPRTAARMEKLLAQRHAARTEVEALKPAADKWQQMDGYLTRHDLAAEDVNLLLGVGAALRRGDFKAFRDGVMPYIELANQALGISLAPDIQAKLEAGEITAEAAKELSTTRFAHSRLQGQTAAAAKATETAAREAAQAEVQATTAHAVSRAVTDWEQEIKARDPDYAKKAPAVLLASRALMAELGAPQTAEAAIAMAKRAYDDATRMFAAAMPAPVPTRPAPSGAQAVNGARARPTSLMEAAQRGLEKARGS